MFKQKNQSLVLLRGLPGSGKSSLAHLLSEQGKYPVFCIDDYFLDKNGVYLFDYAQNHLAYKQCETLTEEALKNGLEKVFVANTFTLEWEIIPYFKMAAQYHYHVYVVTVEKHHENTNIHGVSQEQIEKMAAKYKVKLY